MRSRSETRDPIHRWFFNDHEEEEANTIDKFVATQKRYIDESQRRPAPSDRTIFDGEPPRKKLRRTPPRQSLLDLVSEEQGVIA